MNRFSKFRKDKRGMFALVLGLVITLVALGVVLGVGLLINNQIQTTVEALDLGEAGNATRTSLYANINQAFSLSAIVPIVAGAALVIGAIIAGFAVKNRMT
jgi:Flp pilus assembly pilin Flp